MNNKGFTLIELLAVLVILGIIMALAATSYSAVSTAMKKSQRENTISQIEIAASRYAYDTGETMAFVDTLVTEGYLESDEDDGTINDPVNGGKLNCYIVEMDKVSDYYNATFLDGYYYEDSDGCDETKLVKQKSGITITIVNGTTTIDSEDYANLSDEDKWLTGEVTLQASFSTAGAGIECSNINNSCVWTSTSGQEVENSDDITIKPSSILSSTYTFQYTVKDSDDGITRYTASVELYIDNESPSIYENETIITNEHITSSSKTISIVASDGNGSGIDGYAILSGSDVELECGATSIKNTYTEEKKFKICLTGSSDDDCDIYISSSSATIAMCVKDNVGKYARKTITIYNFG